MSTTAAHAETDYRYDGSPLSVGAPRTNFLALDTIEHRRRNPILNNRFITGIVPALFASGAIIALAIIRYVIAIDQGRTADIHLLEVKAGARYPLATRELVQERSVIVKQTVDQIAQSANGVTPNLATLVNVGNAIPSNVRVKAVALGAGRATVTDGEALDYNAIVAFSEHLSKTYPITIATAGLGADPSNGVGATERSNTWKWTGYINLAPPAPRTNGFGVTP